jgi:hypothetical protein
MVHHHWTMANQEKITRAQGATATEKYLQRLCERTFLSLWSYPSVFRQQGNIPGKADGKEVCDLLVVFGEHVLLFSDKACAYPDSGIPELNWKRWFRRAVWNSAEQLWGAERWIRNHPSHLFLDRKCMRPFPLQLPHPEQAQFHLIVVAHGISPIIRRVHGGSGSLMIDTSVAGFEAHVSDQFATGDLDPQKTFVHVMDEESIALLMRTRDTIADFVSYLGKRHLLFRGGGPTILAPGEEELLAIYLRNVDRSGEHNFVFPIDEKEAVNGIFLQEGFWDRFERHPQRLAQLEADKISYAWDALIETFNRHTLAGTHYRLSARG